MYYTGHQTFYFNLIYYSGRGKIAFDSKLIHVNFYEYYKITDQ